MRNAANRPTPPEQNYFISYTDLLVGVLFIFIMLLVTYALTYRSAEEGYRTRLKGLEERIEMRSELLRRLEGNLRKQNVRATAEPDQGVLRLSEDVLFERGRADLGPEARRALTILGAELAKELPCYGQPVPGVSCPYRHGPILEAVYIEGHTDDIRINTPRFPSNWQLSSERAIVTYNFLRERHGLLATLRNEAGTAALLGASAYADTRPVPNARSRDDNRRIDFRFLLGPPSREQVQRELDAR